MLIILVGRHIYHTGDGRKQDFLVWSSLGTSYVLAEVSQVCGCNKTGITPMHARKILVLALSSVACAVAHGVAPAPTQGLGFAVQPSLRLSAPAGFFPGADSAAVQDRAAIPAAAGVSMMACRRNLKKEKRARNEACARKYRKAPVSRFARGGKSAGSSRAAEVNAEKRLE